jgi:hypothetical protein
LKEFLDGINLLLRKKLCLRKKITKRLMQKKTRKLKRCRNSKKRKKKGHNAQLTTKIAACASVVVQKTLKTATSISFTKVDSFTTAVLSLTKTSKQLTTQSGLEGHIVNSVDANALS